MSGGIYVLEDGGRLHTLSAAAYDSEDLLQTLLARYPDILAGEQISSDSPQRWILVKREAGVPDDEGGAGRWSLDHLFLDQDGIPTLVEVKRSTDTRIRREVVGQMLDYAANAMAYWSVESLHAQFEQTCAANGDSTDNVLSAFLGEGADPAAFWQAVKTNLQAGRLRLLFVADEIPDELRRIVEFLNAQMDPAEVLAVEIKQFVGGSLKTLVPRVIGHTAEADRRKGRAARQTRQWDEASFMAELAKRGSQAEVDVAMALLKWGRQAPRWIAWGQGVKSGSFAPVFDHDRLSYTPFAAWTHGAVELQFQYEASKVSPERRLELLRRLNEIPEVSLPESAVDRRPNIPLRTLQAQRALDGFVSAMEWYFAEASRE